MNGWTLAVDIGSACTTAAAGDAGRREAVLFDGRPGLPSLACLAPGGRWLTGQEAEAAAQADPRLAERDPLRALLEGRALRIGGRQVPAAEPAAALLARARTEAVRRRAGRQPAALVLLHPAGWSEADRRLLSSAAGRTEPRLLPVPVAVGVAALAAWPEAVPELPLGGVALVVDVGSALEITAVRRTGRGFELAGVPPLRDPRLGGAELDGVLWEVAAAGEGAAPAAPPGALRSAKEALSAQPSAELRLPGVTLKVDRSAFEAAAEDVLQAVAAQVAAAVAEAGPAVVCLTGGTSRMPRCAELVAAAVGATPLIHLAEPGAKVLGALRAVLDPPRVRVAAQPPGVVTALTAYRTGRSTGEQRATGAAPVWYTGTRQDVRGIAVDGEAVYALGDRVGAVSAGDHAPRWTSPPLPGLDRLVPAYDTLYGLGAAGVVALDARSGAVRWTAEGALSAVPGAGGRVHLHDGATVSTREAVSGRKLWSFRPGGRPAGLAVPGDGCVYAAAAGRVWALDADGGEELWRYGGAPGPVAVPAVADSLVVLSDLAGVRALDAATGATVWSAPGPPGVGVPVLAGTSVCVAVGSVLTCLDLHTGTRRWQVAEHHPYPALPFAGSGIVCARSGNGYVGYDLATGRGLWRFVDGAATDIRSEPVIADGQVHTVRVQLLDLRAPLTATSLRSLTARAFRTPPKSFLTALDAHTGTVRWREILDNSVAQEPIVSGRALFTFVLTAAAGTGRGTVIARLDATTGATPW